MKLILFDCDGTLVDSQHNIVEAMTNSFIANNLTPPSDRDIRSIIGLSLAEAIKQLHLAGAKDDELVMRLVESYKQAYRDLRERDTHFEHLYEGAKETVQQLAAHDDILLGIATGKSMRGVRSVFEAHDLGEYFATIQTADNAPSKPNPGMIEQALGETGANKNQTVMIGDTSFDMQMARNASVTGIGVSWGYHEPHALHFAGASDVIETFPNLLKYILEYYQIEEPVV